MRISRQVYDSSRISAAEAARIDVERHDRRSVRPDRRPYSDDDMLRQAGGTYDDTEGLINEPLSVKEIQAVIFFKRTSGDEFASASDRRAR